MSYSRVQVISALLTLSCILFTGCAVPGYQALSDPGDERASAESIDLAADASSDGSEEAEDAAGQDGVAVSAPLSESEQIAQNMLDAALELTDAAQELWASGDSEKAIESLDNAYLMISNVSPENGSKLTQQKDELRFMISKRVMEIYASRITKVNGTHKEIPLVINDHVEREIRQFQTAEREFFLESYDRSGMFRDDMVKALKDAGMPEELSWLPLIESGFKTKALSRARAFGLWQFIPSTGYKFGLKRSDWIDERLHPEKATKAAIAYMRELHQIFGDWATVLAAYNCGEGSVLRVIRSQNINYLDNFWDLYERLPRETARYYPRFLAVLAIVKEPGKYGFTLDPPSQKPSFETVSIEKQLHLKSVAEKLGTSVQELTLLNPELRREATPPTPYVLKVPVGSAEALMASIATIPKYTPPRVEYVYHRVRRGETLSVIAMRYRTSVRRIVETNRLRSERFIRVGQRLKIPVAGASS